MRGLTVDREGVALALALGGARVWPRGIGERPAVQPLADSEARTAMLTLGMAMLPVLRLEGEMDEVKPRQCRINGSGDRVVVDSVDGERCWTRTLRVDSEGEVSAHPPEEMTVAEVSRWRMAVQP